MLTILAALLLTPPVVEPPPVVDAPPKAGKSWIAPKEKVESVVVSVEGEYWVARYKGEKHLFAGTFTAAEVEKMAGEWGRGVGLKSQAPPPAESVQYQQVQPQFVQPVLPRLFSPPLVPVMGGT